MADPDQIPEDDVCRGIPESRTARLILGDLERMQNLMTDLMQTAATLAEDVNRLLAEQKSAISKAVAAALASAEANDAQVDAALKAIDATVTQVAPPIVVTPATFTGTSGSGFTGSMAASGGDGGPYTFAVDTAPGGLSMDSTGAWSGTPSASGTFTCNVTATDGAGVTGTVEVTFTIS